MTKITKLLSHALAVILAVACVQCIALSAFAQDIKLNVKTKENANVDVSGSKITVTDTSFNDDVWNSKALVDTGVTLEPGKQYTVSYTLSGKEGVGEFFLCKGESLDARYSDSFTTGAGSHVVTFTAASPKLFLGMQVGNVGSDNSVTADIASINEVAFTNDFTVLKSNNCEVSIEGGKLTVTDTSDNNDVWDSVVLFDAGMKIKVGQPYALDYMLSGEHGVGEVFMCKSLDLGNRYDTTFANDTGSKHRYFVAQTERVLIGMQVGNIGKGNSVTIEGVNAVYTPVPVPTLVDMTEFDDMVKICATDNSYDNGIWTSKVLYKLADNLTVGQEYEVSFTLDGDHGVGEIFLNKDASLDFDKHYLRSDRPNDADNWFVFLNEKTNGNFTMRFTAESTSVYLGMQMGNIGKGNSVNVTATKPVEYNPGVKYEKNGQYVISNTNDNVIKITATDNVDLPPEENEGVWTSRLVSFLGNLLQAGKNYIAKIATTGTGEVFLQKDADPEMNVSHDNVYGAIVGTDTVDLSFKATSDQLYVGLQYGAEGTGNEFTAEVLSLTKVPYYRMNASNRLYVTDASENSITLVNRWKEADAYTTKALYDSGIALKAGQEYILTFNLDVKDVDPTKTSAADMNDWIKGAGFYIPQSVENENWMSMQLDDSFRNKKVNTITFTAAEDTNLYFVVEVGALADTDRFTISNIQVVESPAPTAFSLCSLSPDDAALIEEEESPAEESPAEESPAEESPAEESPAEESPAEESPAEESPAEESPAEKSPAEESPAEESPAEESPAEESPVNESPVNESPVNESPVNEVSEG